MKAKLVYESINSEIKKVSNLNIDTNKNKIKNMRALFVYESLSNLGKVLTLEDLAEITARTQEPGSQEIAEKAFLEFYKDTLERKGNAGIIKAFKKATDLKLKTIIRGKYAIVYDRNY